MKFTIFILLLIGAATLYKKNEDQVDAFFGYQGGLGEFRRTAGPVTYGRIVSCCSFARHANGHYASTSLPRTSFSVEYHGGEGAWLRSQAVEIVARTDCKVYSRTYGSGRWQWANGGTVFEFRSGERIGFPQQTLDGMPDWVMQRCAA